MGDREREGEWHAVGDCVRVTEGEGEVETVVVVDGEKEAENVTDAEGVVVVENVTLELGLLVPLVLRVLQAVAERLRVGFEEGEVEAVVVVDTDPLTVGLTVGDTDPVVDPDTLGLGLTVVVTDTVRHPVLDRLGVAEVEGVIVAVVVVEMEGDTVCVRERVEEAVVEPDTLGLGLAVPHTLTVLQAVEVREGVGEVEGVMVPVVVVDTEEDTVCVREGDVVVVVDPESLALELREVVSDTVRHPVLVRLGVVVVDRVVVELMEGEAEAEGESVVDREGKSVGEVEVDALGVTLAVVDTVRRPEAERVGVADEEGVVEELKETETEGVNKVLVTVVEAVEVPDTDALALTLSVTDTDLHAVPE